MANIAIKTEVSGSLDALAAQAREVMLQQDSPFSKAFAQAEIMAAIRTQLDAPGVMAAVMSLQGSAIGFRTDKDKDGGYSASAVKDAVIEATMRGLFPVGNEFNVIAGRCYVTNEGFTRLLKGMEGLTNLKINPEPPQANGNVKVHVSCNHKGIEIKEVLEFSIRCNAGMGADGIIGKARKKAKKWLYEYLTGSEMPEGEVDDLANARNVTPVSPFERPAPAETPFEADWSKATTEEITAEIGRIMEAEALTMEQVGRWAQERCQKPLMELPVAMLRGICKRPGEWAAKVREVAP